MPFVGVDIGGSFLKGAVLDPVGQALHHVVRTAGPQLETPVRLARTLDPVQLAASVVELTNRLVEKVDGTPEGILLSGQMHGVVLVDGHGKPRDAIYTWQDNRDTIADNEGSPLGRLASLLNEDDRTATGNELRPGIPLSTLHRLALEGVDVDGLMPASLLSFCAATLAARGPNRFDMHATDAAAHGFLEIRTGAWHAPTLQKAGLDGLRLPDVHADITMIGRLHGTGCPVYTAIGDHQASLLGIGLAPGELSINIATGSQVSVIEDMPMGSAQARPYFDGSFLRTVTPLPAGRALNALFSLLAELGGPSGDDLWRSLEARVADVPTTPVRASLDFFAGTSEADGWLRHLTEDTLDVGNVVRAALDSMVGNYLEAARSVGWPPPVERLALSGGLVQRFEPLRSSLVESFGAPNVRLCHDDDASLAGLLELSRMLA